MIRAGTALQINTKNGKLTVIAGAGDLRTIAWDRGRGEICLKKEALGCGLKEKVDWTGFAWVEQDGISTCEYREKTIEVGNEAQALYLFHDNEKDWVYSSEGIAARWAKYSNENLIQISVTQILINGERPKNLLGADNARLQLVRRVDN